jgi:hypothetical protein
MKKIVIYLAALGFILCTTYYFTFMLSKKVKNINLISIKNKGNNKLIIQTLESFKYINKIKLTKINDSIMKVDIYTTTVYNPFAIETTKIVINLNQNFNHLLFENNIIKRDSLSEE